MSLFHARSFTQQRKIASAIAASFTFMLPLWLAATTTASAHCFIGARFFPATLSSEDPCVADELSLPTFTTIREPGEDDGTRRTNSYSFDYAKSITPDFGLSVGRSFLNIKPQGLSTVNGWDNFEVGAKYHLFKDPVHEFILSAGVDVDLGGTGSRRAGAESFSTVTPQIYFGKGFGDLPESLALLKPFAVTGVIGYGIPSRSATGDEFSPRTLNTAISIQYSLPYLQANVRDTGFASIANHLIPLVEFNFETPVNTPQKGQSIGTINPGFIWAEKKYQIGLQAIIPANNRTGNNVGFLAQLHFYLDDVFPNSIGKPLFGAR